MADSIIWRLWTYESESFGHVLEMAKLKWRETLRLNSLLFEDWWLVLREYRVHSTFQSPGPQNSTFVNEISNKSTRDIFGLF